MLELNQSVIVITEKGVAYDGYVMARASGENGSAAYQIGLEGAGELDDFANPSRSADQLKAVAVLE